MNELKIKEIEKEMKMVISDFQRVISSLTNELDNGEITAIQQRIESYTNESTVKVAFIGQYSAGKSTIISALTGNEDIKIGQDITTDRANPYSWGNIILVDTPGILAGNTDHDAETLNFIDQADLIVYVVTANGFDQVIGENFRKLIIDEKRSKRTMLVVNKISMEDNVNVENWEKNIEEVIEPLTKNEMRLTFIDAQDYLEHKQCDDVEDARELLQLSNFLAFQQKVDEFASEEGLLSKLIAPLNQLMTECRITINRLSTDSKGNQVQVEYLEQQRGIITRNKVSLEKETKKLLRQFNNSLFESQVHNLEQIRLGMPESEINEIELKIKNGLEDQIEQFSIDITDLMEKTRLKLKEELEILEKIEVDIVYDTKNDVPNIKLNLPKGNLFEKIAEKSPEVASGIGRFLQWAGPKVQEMAKKGAKEGAEGLDELKDTDLHKFVGPLVKFFNKNADQTKVLETVSKLTEKAGKLSEFGKVLDKANFVIAPAMTFISDRKEEKETDRLRKSKSEINRQILEWQKTIENSFKEELTIKVSEFFTPLLRNVNHQITELTTRTDLESNTVVSLRLILKNSETMLEKC